MAFACLRFDGTPDWVLRGAKDIATEDPRVTVEIGYFDQIAGVITLRAEEAGLITSAVRQLFADPVCTRNFRVTREFG